MQVLDDLDHRLIAELREDARLPMTSLAKRLKVSRATVQARLDRMIASGAVLGFTVRAARGPQALRAIMTIEIEGRSTTTVIRKLRGFPQITALHTTNGAWDLVAEISADDIPDFDRILREIRNVEGILNSETSLLLSSV